MGLSYLLNVTKHLPCFYCLSPISFVSLYNLILRMLNRNSVVNCCSICVCCSIKITAPLLQLCVAFVICLCHDMCFFNVPGSVYLYVVCRHVVIEKFLFDSSSKRLKHQRRIEDPNFRQ